MQRPLIRYIFTRVLIPAALILTEVGIADHIPGGFRIEDAKSVTEAVANISDTLELQGFSIDITIDHAANAAGAGLELRPTQLLLFSNSHIDMGLIQRGQTSAIDLPGKYLVWQDESGVIRLAYNTLGYLLERHDLPVRDRLLSDLNKSLRQFGTAPTGLLTLDSGLVVVDSAKNVERTVHDLQAELLARGFIIPRIIDYSARAQAANRRIRATSVIIFGNPAVGTQLMQNRQTVGLDLPQKFLVWEDEEHQVHIAYNDPRYVASRHGIEGLEPLLKAIAAVLEDIARLGGSS